MRKLNKDTKLLYAVSSINLAIILLSFFIDLGSSRIVTACLLLLLTPATLLLIRRRKALSINKKEVLLILGAIGGIYAVLQHMTGMYFGYYKNPYFISQYVLLAYVLPILAIIIFSELIRSVLLSQENRAVNVLSFLTCTVSEVLIFAKFADIFNYNYFMDLVGLTLFPALCGNLLYHFIAKKYGCLPNIVYRVLTVLYVYFVPRVSAVSDALMAVIKMVVPLLALALISALYEKKKKTVSQKGSKLGKIAVVLTIILIVSVAMLISCQFRYGAIVIATESMTGEINKGDMIIYEAYDDQTIKEGQVIVFLDHKSRIVHRVVKIDRSSGETRYYTKGDANEDWDIGYRTAEDIVGLTDFKVAYIGYPTLWLRDFIKSTT